MLRFKDIRQAALIGLWFMFLTFPLLVIKVNTIEQTILWRWSTMAWVGGVSFAASLLARLGRRLLAGRKARRQAEQTVSIRTALGHHLRKRKVYLPLLAAGLLFLLIFPTQFSTYQTTIMTTALIFVMLGLGLNIVVGVAGLLDLGYVAFYAVGAYSYALLHLHFGLGFWTVLPLAGLLGALFGVLLGFPVLRLRGDYLAIVTMGFGEIIRLILENWDEFSHGPRGISNIPRPGFFGMDLTLDQSITFIYYLMILMVAFTIFVVNRLQNSRIGRAWYALREDEIACQAMGIDKTRTKLTAFALGATWAGMAGVFFAAQNTYVNPKSFTFLESAIILCIVVLGGMGSIIGVIIAALVLILLPEYLRVLADYRMLVFGAILVAMMIFRPQGIMATMRRRYTLKRSTVA